MKYAIVIPDGCADEPQESLGGLTPLQAAHKPHMDRVGVAEEVVQVAQDLLVGAGEEDAEDVGLALVHRVELE